MTKELKPWELLNYTHSYWENGRRLQPGVDRSSMLLCFETGFFGLKMDIGNLTKFKFGKFSDHNDNIFHRPISYQDAIEKRHRYRMEKSLTEEPFHVEISHKGKLYRAVSTGAVTNINDCRLRESGKIVQHYDFLSITFQDDQGHNLWNRDRDKITSTFSIMIWPDSLTFTMEISQSETDADNNVCSPWHDKDFVMTIKFKHWAISSTEKEFNKISTSNSDSISLSLNCNLTNTREILQDWKDKFRMHMHGPSKALEVKYPLKFDWELNCFLLDCFHPNRRFATNYNCIRDYDEFQFLVRNLTNVGNYVPVCIYIRPPANVTGLCPILCDENYCPLGVPVQLSKNWHDNQLGHYAKLYALLPSPKNDHYWNTYCLRIAYGFYGTLPSASHANLSLIGYGGHGGRWEQLAVGCWGETYCMDVELDCVPNIVTDIRALMCRNGPRGRSWGWTDAGWGGDWLNIQNTTGHKLLPVGLKTAYVSQGPCLTEVHYNSYYGSQHEIDAEACVRTCRTDDYARTFTKLTYNFNDENIENINSINSSTYLYMLGGGPNYDTPNVAFGNVHGLLEQHELPKHYPVGKVWMQQKQIIGKGPWWISFHTQGFANDNTGKGQAWRGLVIRSYSATFGTTKIYSPSISLVSSRTTTESSYPNMKLFLTPPKQISKFSPGDRVEMEVELITIPLSSENYYGPNIHFQQHLTQYPRSWQTVHREAKENDIKITNIDPDSTIVQQLYPLIFQVKDESKTKFSITSGGIGALPIRFENLSTYGGYSLYRVEGSNEIKFDLPSHGNDFWQTDYDPKISKYSITFNVPMDDLPTESTWIFKKE